jgi:multiple sugar transport system permease protein
MQLIEFVGLENYRYVFAHPDFLAALRNSFVYVFWSLLIGYLVPIALGIIINEIRHAKSLFKVCVYLPCVIPGMAMVLLYRYVFRVDNVGLLNVLLAKIGIGPQIWLTNPSWTIPLIIFAITWKGAGSSTLLYIAGLQGIDPELYEAAIIDGAGIAARVRHISLPGIFNLARMLLILQIIAVFQILFEPMVLTSGGPNNASISMMQLVFRFAFERFDYPKASAVAVVVCVILAFLTILYFRITKRQDA